WRRRKTRRTLNRNVVRIVRVRSWCANYTANAANNARQEGNMNNLLDFIENARAGTLKESGPRTTVRERRRSLYRAYYHATGQTRKDQARQARYQAESRETAHRHGEAWDANDLATALRLQQPLMVSAQDAQRTYAA